MTFDGLLGCADSAIICALCLSLSLEHVQMLAPEVPFLFQFMGHIANDEERSDNVIACCAGLLG